MADKYIRNNSGTLTETEATVSSAGAANAGDIVALDANGKLDLTTMPTGIAPDISVLTASENLVAGDFVNVWNDAGTPKVRKADGSTAGKEAHGFVLAAVTSGNPANVYHEGANDQVTGQTAGMTYLSAATAGLATGAAPSASGNVVQRLGVATSATSINVELQQPIVLA
jgi:hypothetical protein